MILVSYFVAMLVLSKTYIASISMINDELYILSKLESYVKLGQNSQREMIYNATKLIMRNGSFDVARDIIG